MRLLLPNGNERGNLLHLINSVGSIISIYFDFCTHRVQLLLPDGSECSNQLHPIVSTNWIDSINPIDDPSADRGNPRVRLWISNGNERGHLLYQLDNLNNSVN